MVKQTQNIIKINVKTLITLSLLVLFVSQFLLVQGILTDQGTNVQIPIENSDFQDVVAGVSAIMHETAHFVPDRFGNPNSAIQLNGVDDWVQFPTTYTGMNLVGDVYFLTISLWAYIEGAGPLIENNYNFGWEEFGYYLAVTSGKQLQWSSGDALGDQNAATNCLCPGTINFNEWIEITVVKENQVQTFYVNGTVLGTCSVADAAMNAGPSARVAMNNYHIFGTTRENSNYPCRGSWGFAPTPCYANIRLDDIKIFDRAVTSEELVAKCDVSCATCDLSDTTVCLTCSHSSRDPNTGCSCKSGFYDAGVFECTQCPFPCSECDNTGTCTECQVLSNRDINPVCLCLTGFLEVSQVCEACNPLCKTCSSNVNNCDVCVNSRINEPSCDTCSDLSRDGANYCACKDKFYDNGVDAECQPCLSPCLLCQSQTKCISCINYENRDSQTCQCQLGYEEKDSKCVKCPAPLFCQPERQGYFAMLGLDGKLVFGECDPKCQKCTNTAQECTECSNNITQDINILCDCSKGYYEAQISQNNSQTTCLECFDKCYTCEYQYDQCLTCRDPQYRDAKHKCQCILGYEEDFQGICQGSPCLKSMFREINVFSGKCECMQGFKKISGIEECQKCYNFNSECLIECPNGFIQNEKLSMCETVDYEFLDNVLLIILVSFLIVLVFVVLWVFLINILNKKIVNFDQKQTDLNNINNEQQQQENLQLNPNLKEQDIENPENDSDGNNEEGEQNKEIQNSIEQIEEQFDSQQQFQQQNQNAISIENLQDIKDD